MAVHVLATTEYTSCHYPASCYTAHYLGAEGMFAHSVIRRVLGERLEQGFGRGMDGWMDNWNQGIVRMFCNKVIENKKLSDNLGKKLWIKGGVRNIRTIP